MQKQSAHEVSAPAPALPLPLLIGAAIALLGSLVIAVPGDNEWWKVIVLGVVQGITEWLPISSTGHLLIVSDLLGYSGSIGGTFEIFIQFGTVLSVVAFYAGDLMAQGRALLRRGTHDEALVARRLWIGVFIAALPAALIGIVFRDFIKAVLFETPQVIAGALIVGGVIFLIIERFPLRAPRTHDPGRVTPWQALGIGIARSLRLFQGCRAPARQSSVGCWPVSTGAPRRPFRSTSRSLFSGRQPLWT